MVLDKLTCKGNPSSLVPRRTGRRFRVVRLVYYVTEPCNPADPDDGRIAWNDPRIGFDWRIENI